MKLLDIEVINSDCDGVLYNLTEHLAYMDGCSYQQYWIDKAAKQGMKLADYYSERMNEHIPNGLFFNGRPMIDAQELLDCYGEIRIKTGIKINCLTAGPNNHPLFDTVKKDKMAWFKKIGIDHYFDEIIVTNGSLGKLDYSSKNTLLVDDHVGSERRFKDLNYPFLLHRNAKDTVAELKRLFL